MKLENCFLQENLKFKRFVQIFQTRREFTDENVFLPLKSRGKKRGYNSPEPWWKMGSPFFPFFHKGHRCCKSRRESHAIGYVGSSAMYGTFFAVWLYETKNRTKTTLNLGQTATGDPMKIYRLRAYNVHIFSLKKACI